MTYVIFRTLKFLKMKKFKFLVPALALGILTALSVQAQDKQADSKEIIIKLKSGDVKTIKSGEMSPIIIDGKLLSPEEIKSITVVGTPRRSPLFVQGYRVSQTGFLGVVTKQSDKVGAEITEVEAGSPAEKAGLRKGDIITNVQSTPITNPESLSETIRSLKPDQKITIQILRNGKKQDISATLGAQKNNEIRILTDSLFVNQMPFNNFGFKIPNDAEIQRLIRKLPFYPESGLAFGLPMRPQLGLQIQETENNEGVTVLKVNPGSLAEKAGIQVGDLITAINGNSIKSMDDITGKITEKDGEEYKLNIIRDKKPLIVTIKIPKKLKKAEL